MLYRYSLLAVVAVPGLCFAANPIFTINTQTNVKPISRLIYGVNDPAGYSNVPYTRLGGNRWTAYNWTNNASNAGSDYIYQNDDYLGGGNTPGGAMIPTLNANAAGNAATLITIPINGYVAADTLQDGDVRNTPNYLQTRFRQDAAAKGSAFTLTPNPANPIVYQDEFVNWVKTMYPASQTNANKSIYFSLDNEPDLWQSTHLEVHPAAVTYAELIQKTIAYSTAIKAVAPSAVIFGPANYGFDGYVRLQDAPDANNRDFQEVYLQQMKAASDAAGKRLVDVLDVHWYPEATGGGVRIDGTETTPAVVAARLQAPRSLWDPTYTETSWIAQDWYGNQPIKMLPTLQAKINTYNPGTKLSISEYNYGGGQDISGGIAQADVLGIFGQQGVFAANEWHLNTDESFIQAAFRMYRNFDGHNATFGDTAISASTDDIADTSIYASVDAANPNRMILVAINKTGGPLTAKLDVANLGSIYRTASVYTLTGGSSTIASAGTLTMSDPANFFYTLPAYSVSTLSFAAPGLFGDANLDGRITFDDFLKLDYGYLHHLTGWSNGDFSGDGVINATDFSLAFQGYQGQLLADAEVLSSDPLAIPEPATLAMFAAGAMIFSARGGPRNGSLRRHGFR